MDYEPQPVQMYCNNCGHKCIGYKSRDQAVRIVCGCCGTVMISKQKTKRIIDIRVHAPPGQRI